MGNRRGAALATGRTHTRALLGASGGSYAGIDLGRSKRLGGLLWLVGAGVIAVLLPLAPPTHATGSAAGWICAGALLILAIAGAARLVKKTSVTPAELLFMSYAALMGIALLEWLAGGRDTPYHQLYLLVVLFASATHPARRVVAFLGVFLVAISASGWEYGWSAAETGDAVIQITTALGLGLAVLALMTSIRAQRVALSDEGDEARRLAELDPLTGLGNRRALAEALESVLDDPAANSVLAVFDLNGFKSYNDRFGHPAGDALLVRLANCLQESVREHGRAYRMGGDEFCILAQQDRADGATWGEIGIAALSECGRGFSISASHGEVTLPREAAEPDAALRLADQRLYASKAQRGPAADCQATSALLQVLAERNPELGTHVDGVTHLCEEVGRAFALDDARIECLRHAATLHDIGKAAIPDAILHKPGPLSDEEWSFMRRHTIIGERILAAAPSLQDAAHFVRASHERFDGGGYPDGLTGEAIPLESRIICVCDAYDAMVSNRPYRDAKSTAEALAELQRCAGSQFDPVVVEQFARSLLSPAAAAQPAV
jgi:diguanylate cyclase (GGDEF)-like protein